MKIIGSEESGKIGFKPTQKKGDAKGGEDFTKIFAEESNKVKGAKIENTGQAQQAAVHKFPSHIPLTSLEPIGQAGKSVNSEKLAAMTEKVLTQLEFFKSALENPKVDISKFSPLVESLKNNGKRLEELSAKTSPDISLKSLADETATLATIEATKFYRGDYG